MTITNEPLKGLKENFKRLYKSDVINKEEYFS